MIIRGGAKGGSHSWQLVLADLALILFLVTLTALVNSDSMEDSLATGSPSAQSQAAPPSAPYVAPAQALFRPTSRGPTLTQWLAEQPADPRTTLTIIAQHSGPDQDLMWQNAQTMASSIAGSKVRIRVVITSGATSDLYASLAYDDLAYDDLAYESANEERGTNVQTSQ